jgi:ABC-type sugar transport system ATPase subunit
VRQLAQHSDAAVTAGIRPEHIGLRPATEDVGAKGMVVYREPRGDADVLTIRLDGIADTVVAETAGPSSWRAGDSVRLRIDPDRVLVFDTGSGRNLAVAA